MIDGLILSFQLFTRIPINKSVEFSKENLKNALTFLPFIGFVLGAMVGLTVDFVGERNPFIGGALGMVLYIVLSGGMHLDGLADMADGFLSNSDKERTLDIMKDSLIGSFGTIALICYCILKTSLYSAFTHNVWIYIVLSTMISRFSVLYLINRGNLARPGGFGARMKEALEDYKVPMILYILFLVMLIIFFDIKFIAVPALCFFVTSSILFISNKKIDGVTGDIYGAAIEINELVALLGFWGLQWI